MVEPKVRLSIEVPGATILSSQECEENPKENYNLEKLVVETPAKKKWQKPRKEVLTIKTRKSRTATQSISICKEAYLAMIGAQGEQGSSHPYNISHKKWEGMTSKERLEVHMKEIAEHIGGVGAKFSYTILDD